MNILVVGAGIGGLVSALALSRDGHEVTLIEQQPVFKALNSALLLPKSVVQILANLSVNLSGRGVEVPGVCTTDETGRTLISPVTEALSISRAELHDALVTAIGNRVEVIFAATIKRIRITDTGVFATWLDSTQEFDLIVGADSMNSSVRSRILGPSPLIYSGYTAWRGVGCETFDAGRFGSTAIEMWGGRTRIILAPLPNDRISYAIITKSPSRAPAPRWPSGFAKLTAQFGEPWAAVQAGISGPPRFHRDLYVLPKPAWGVPRVLLVGDAAHLLPPSLWQGASLAVEDGAAVALALRGTSGALDTFKKYESLRDSRVRTAMLLSRRLSDLQRSHGRIKSFQNQLIRLFPSSLVAKHNELLAATGWKIAEELLASP